MKQDIYAKLEEILRQKLLTLPEYVAEFSDRIELESEIRTRIEYVKDVGSFLTFLQSSIPISSPLSEIPIDVFKELTDKDIRNFLNYVSDYVVSYESTQGKEVERRFQNSDISKARKISSLHEFFRFLREKGYVEKNITENVRVHVRKKARIKSTLTPEEMIYYLDGIRFQDYKTDFQKSTILRDYAICSLLSYSGIRVGELVQLDVNDVDLVNKAIVVTRKGGNQEIIPLSEILEESLGEYLKERKKKETDMRALFLSSQNRRMNEKTVRDMLKKHGERLGISISVTPHVFRRTFGTTHYNTFEDIALTGAILGHRSVDTTRKYYAKVLEERIEKSMRTFEYKAKKEESD